MHPSVEFPHTWTFEDLQALPEDVDWRRYEIVDGALVVSPATAPRHEFACAQVEAAIRKMVPPGVMVLGPLAIDLHPSYRIPDLVVVPMSVIAANNPLLLPSEVLLAVEVVSPGSVTTDRITKPAQYAVAGIANFWRVESEPDVALTAYELVGAVYREIGTWRPGQVAQITVPFPVAIAINDLVPPSAAAPTAP